jgi:hypothetical protein
MTDQPWQEQIGDQVRTVRIIVGSLLSGVVMFTVIALVMPSGVGAGPNGPGGDLPLVSWIALGFGVLALLLHKLVPTLVVAGGRKAIQSGAWNSADNPQAKELAERLGTPGMLFALFQTKTIVGGAILEGAAFFNLVAYLIERQWMSLAAAITLACFLLMLLPNREGVIRWIEEQLDRIAEANKDTF